jgi:hypothetical protein
VTNTATLAPNPAGVVHERLVADLEVTVQTEPPISTAAFWPKLVPAIVIATPPCKMNQQKIANELKYHEKIP